jgi:hypothetical protein
LQAGADDRNFSRIQAKAFEDAIGINGKAHDSYSLTAALQSGRQ